MSTLALAGSGGVNYERDMITSHNRGWAGTRAGGARTGDGRRLSRAALALAAFVALAPECAAARDAGLLEQCWPGQSLSTRPGEGQPAKGAAGHAQRIPNVAPAAAAPVAAGLQGAIRRVKLPPGRKLIALTLDLCEQPGEIAGYDGAVFDALRAHGTRATVFAGGKWLMTHPERSQQLIADPLLEIGSHGWAHRNVRGLTGTDLRQEMRGPEAAFQVQRNTLTSRQCAAAAPEAVKRLQTRLALYRFPYGACNAEALAALAEDGVLAIQWDVSTGDASKETSATAIANMLVNGVRPGSIILAHANGRGYNTAEALRIALPKLKAKGYELVTVSELLAAGEPQITPTCYDHRPGDTDRYDKLFLTRLPRLERADDRAPATLPR